MKSPFLTHQEASEQQMRNNPEAFRKFSPIKRYIEIVYDNSGSMNGFIGNKRKYEIAQELFEKEILPAIGILGDYVVLRLLTSDCQKGISRAELLPNHRVEMLYRIKSIQHDQSTPLFYTIYDAVEACRNTKANEHLIFVLTDGDDTCGVAIEGLIDQDTLKKYVPFYKVLLVQFAVDSTISSNNLTALANTLGAQSISLESVDSVNHMRSKLKNALNASGFSNKMPLDHCFDTLPGANRTWDEVEESGIDFHQAMLLFEKGYLSWKPEWVSDVSALQYAELMFLFSLVFKTGIPDDLTRTMLTQLKKPYYYSFDCIYWDFSKARWRYFVRQNEVKQLDNPDAKFQDAQTENLKEMDIHSKGRLNYENDRYYNENEIYRINSYDFIAASEFQLLPDKSFDMPSKRRTKTLRPGDRVIFKRK